jgi:lysophospholipase L1-like esterase
MYSVLEDEKGNFKKEYTKDGLHPNDLGYVKITKKLLEYMR